MTQDYKTFPFHQYPIFAEEMSIEGSFKRFESYPTPKQVYDRVLMGLPKVFPLTGEPIPLELAADSLNSFTSELEMKTGCNLSEVTHFHSIDWYPDMHLNYSSVQLPQWPATQIISYEYKFPHVNSTDNYKVQQLPANWLSLRRNRLSVIPGAGTVQTTHVTGSSYPIGYGVNGAIGHVNAYKPQAVQIIYKAGFPNDHLPAMLADLIITGAAADMLMDLLPVLAPTSSVSTGIDGVSQSAQLNLSQTLTKRLEDLQNRKNEQLSVFKGHFSQKLKVFTIGS